MTAAELYVADPVFRRAVDEWAETGRCDLRMVDLLLEAGLTAAAEAARWAASTGPRADFSDHIARRSGTGHYPRPRRNGGGRFYWLLTPPDEAVCYHRVPWEFLSTAPAKFATFQEAVLALLDNWVVPTPVALEVPGVKQTLTELKDKKVKRVEYGPHSGSDWWTEYVILFTDGTRFRFWGNSSAQVRWTVEPKTSKPKASRPKKTVRRAPAKPRRSGRN